jgi:hypothetical protein
LYSSPNIIRVLTSRRIGWAGHTASKGGMINAYKILIEEPEGKMPKIPLKRPRNRWENSIKI